MKLSFIRYLNLSLLFMGCLAWVSCSKELSAAGNPTTYTIQFTDVVGIAPLKLDTVYTNTLNQEFLVNAFKYYISDIELYSKNGKVISIQGIHHLVDASDSTTMAVSFPAPVDSLTAFSFLVGLDSAIDISGNQSGDLSPSKGMYLSRTSGYIMARLEGISPSSTAPGYQFTYDINGFAGPENVLRRVTFALPGIPLNLNPLIPDTVVISLDADVDAWFQGPHLLSINQYPTCITPGALASDYADNYADMFTLRNVQVK